MSRTKTPASETEMSGENNCCTNSMCTSQLSADKKKCWVEIKSGLSSKKTLVPNPESGEGVDYWDLSGRNIPDTGKEGSRTPRRSLADMFKKQQGAET